jgi:hypothetical protein
MKYLEEALYEAGHEGDISRLTNTLAHEAFLGKGTTKSQINRGSYIKHILTTLYHAGICPDVSPDFNVTTLVESTSGKSRVNAEKSNRPLSEDEIMACADAFFLAGNSTASAKDIMTTSVLALMFATPCRGSEVTMLPVDVEVVGSPMEGWQSKDIDFSEDLNFRYGLRFFPVKGGMPQVKFVTSEMVPVVREAIRRLQTLGAPAREVAVSIMRSGKMPLPDHLKHVRETGEIITKELLQLFGLPPDGKLSSNIRDCLHKVRYGVYGFESVEEWWRSQLPPGWPQVSDVSQVNYTNCLTTVFQFQTSDRNSTRKWMITNFSEDDLFSDLFNKNDRPTVFERLGVTLPDGSYPKIKSHMIRHYLNTVAQQANVPQVHIAHWSGRKNIMQNEAYDHTDTHDVVQEILAKGQAYASDGVGSLTIVDDHPDNAEYREALLRQSIHSTPFGFCTANLRTSPCERAGVCTTCTKLVCIAGHKKHMPAIEADVARRRIAIENIRKKEAAGRRVNPRVKEAMESQLGHATKLLETVTAPENKGSFIRNADSSGLVEFSHDARVLEVRSKRETLGEARGLLE